MCRGEIAKPHSRYFRFTHGITGRSNETVARFHSSRIYWTTPFPSLTSERAWHESFSRGLRDASAPIPIPVVFLGVRVGLCGGAGCARPESEFAIRSRRPVFRHQVDRHKRKHFVQPRLRWPLRLEYYAANRPGHTSRFLPTLLLALAAAGRPHIASVRRCPRPLRATKTLRHLWPGAAGITYSSRAITGFTATTLTGTQPAFLITPNFGGATYFTLDLGGGVEFYPSERWILRAEIEASPYFVGNTAVNNASPSPPEGLKVASSPGTVTDTWRVSTGMSYRPGEVQPTRRNRRRSAAAI